jgi:hypothetical protein
MAEPIDPRLVLEGEDAENFIQYMKHPTCTPEGMQIIRDAKQMAKTIEL